MISQIHNLDVNSYPFKKEELKISLDFEDNESLELEYNFIKPSIDFDPEFKQYLIERKNKIIKNPILNFEQLLYQFQIKKGIISKKIKKEVD